ncbi:MAG: hypothetical protein AAF388_11700 [Bacteroidota bacterium]
MKTLLSIALSLTISFAIGQNAKYQKAMKEAIATLDTDKATALNQFERIATAESGKWLPAYYAAYGYTQSSLQTEGGDRKDALLDKAQEWLDKAQTVQEEHSEISALQAYIYLARIVASPARGMTYTGKVKREVKKAQELNAMNPRAELVMGMLVNGMPAFIGGGKDNACPIFSAAYQKYGSFTPENDLSPDWGRKMNEGYIGYCGESN